MLNEIDFLALSVELTGFEEFDLVATGLVGAYHLKCTSAIAPAALAEIERRWLAVPDGSARGREAAVQDMLSSQELGLDVRRIVMLWYTGSWYVRPPYDAATLSGRSYVMGLMWKAIGAHPMAAAPQGYGAWSLPPPSLEV